MEEYNARAAPLHVGDPRQKIALLDAFVSKYPDSELLVFIYLQYCDAYRQLGDLPRVMKYAERALASSEKPKLDVNTRFESAITWVWAYNNLRSNDVALAAKARDIEDFPRRATQSQTLFEYHRCRGGDDDERLPGSA